MNEVKKMLFLQQRFHLLALFTNPQAACNITPGYAYAWLAGVYPKQNKSAIWHEPYAEQFEIGEAEIDGLYNLLTDRWNAKNPINFYELEGHLGAPHQGQVWSQLLEEIAGNSALGEPRQCMGWNRSKLYKACRYLYLANCFCDEFWSSLLENGPEDVCAITEDFGLDKICFE